jgi:uncharacterized membrane protein
MDDEQGARQASRGPRPKPFRAVLKPHRSLSRDGFLIVMGLLGVVSFITGVVFAALGAWPVLGFFGLDVVIVYFAFKLNYRSGRLVETIEVVPESLKLTRVHPSGERELFDFNPFGVKVLLGESAPRGRNQLRLASAGRDVALGAFLTDRERENLAAVLRNEISRQRNWLLS